jgi:hypothetical protein
MIMRSDWVPLRGIDQRRLSEARLQAPAALPSLPTLGHWHLRDFVAAVATAHKIVAAKNQQAETDEFLRAAVDGAIKVFS